MNRNLHKQYYVACLRWIMFNDEEKQQLTHILIKLYFLSWPVVKRGQDIFKRVVGSEPRDYLCIDAESINSCRISLVHSKTLITTNWQEFILWILGGCTIEVWEWISIYIPQHYDDVIMDVIASQITSLTVVYSIVYSDADQKKHQSSASLAFVRGIHRGPVNSPHKWPVTRKMFPFDDVIMFYDGCSHSSMLGSKIHHVSHILARWLMVLFSQTTLNRYLRILS